MASQPEPSYDQATPIIDREIEHAKPAADKPRLRLAHKRGGGDDDGTKTPDNAPDRGFWTPRRKLAAALGTAAATVAGVATFAFPSGSAESKQGTDGTEQIDPQQRIGNLTPKQFEFWISKWVDQSMLGWTGKKSGNVNYPADAGADLPVTYELSGIMLDRHKAELEAAKNGKVEAEVASGFIAVFEEVGTGRIFSQENIPIKGWYTDASDQNQVTTATDPAATGYTLFPTLPDGTIASVIVENDGLGGGLSQPTKLKLRQLFVYDDAVGPQVYTGTINYGAASSDVLYTIEDPNHNTIEVKKAVGHKNLKVSAATVARSNKDYAHPDYIPADLHDLWANNIRK